MVCANGEDIITIQYSDISNGISEVIWWNVDTDVDLRPVEDFHFTSIIESSASGE